MSAGGAATHPPAVDAEAPAPPPSLPPPAQTSAADPPASAPPEPAEARLAELERALVVADGEVGGIEGLLRASPTPLDLDQLKQLRTRVPVLYGEVERLQLQVDAVAADGTLRAARKRLTEGSAALSERVQQLPPLLEHAARELAERYKAEGNGCFRAHDFGGAITRYSRAIAADHGNAVYLANRSAAHQARGEWAEAASDAKECVRLDVSYAKGYTFLIKSQLALGEHAAAVRTLQAAPMALLEHADVKAVGETLRAQVKAAGNAAFKAGKHDEAIELYSSLLSLDPSQAVFYSNRSAAYQAKQRWHEAEADARCCVRADPLFVKGYLHLAKVQLQQRKHEAAMETVQRGVARLQEEGLREGTQPLQELARTIASQTPRAAADAPAAPPPSGEADSADEWKARGNERYKAGEYAEAVRCYTRAIGAAPHRGAYYGNRAACWMMLGQLERAVDDCSQGLRQEGGGAAGSKLRVRQGTALVRMGKLQRALDVLQARRRRRRRALPHAPHPHRPPPQEGEADAAVEAQRREVGQLLAAQRRGEAALDAADFSVAKACFTRLVDGGATADAQLRLQLARSHAGLREQRECAAQAQQALALDADLLAAYLVRSAALHAMGQRDKAARLLREALARDPEHEEAARALRALRRRAADEARLKEGAAAAMARRRFEEAAALCAEGLRLDADDAPLRAHFCEVRARAYAMLGRARAQGVTRAQREAASGGPAEEGRVRLAASEAVPAEDPADPRAGVAACWRRSLHDAAAAIAADEAAVQPYLLKAQALQQMERWAEAEATLQQCVARAEGARGDQQVLGKLAEAQFLIRKAARPDLYALLGVTGVGSKASEKEIRAAYKKAALLVHPDRLADADEATRKKAEAKFKELGSALDILTNEFTRKLWDEGHDLESIAQRVQMQKQQPH
ncbi:hypothetical protein AB1Y20_023265 [Prymnesium parvum]|uniref:J domain-containing protein n=1 Tax=Prymnesium parvum TaxID=97485 RepID=A0AB34JG57_PRYPA